MLDALTPGEQETLAGLLRKLLVSFETEPGPPPPPRRCRRARHRRNP